MGLVFNQKVRMIWTNKCRKYYEERGYIFTIYGDIFYVDVNDLASNSNKYVVVECNECGFKRPIKYSNIADKYNYQCPNGHTQDYYEKYFKDRGCELLDNYKGNKSKMKFKCACDEIHYISWDKFSAGQRCIKCAKNRGMKSVLIKRGMAMKEFKEIVKLRGIKVISKLNGDYIYRTKKIDFKCKCGEKRSGNLYQIINSDCKYCGFKKTVKALSIKGKIPSSLQQKYIHSIVGGEINYPVDSLCLDIAFPNEKIYIEYDGGGHDLSVILGSRTKEDFIKKEIRRSKFLKSKGWREVRIVSKKDYIPSEETLEHMMQFAKNNLTDNIHHIKFDIDKGLVAHGEFTYKFEYGKIKRLNSKRVQYEIC